MIEKGVEYMCKAFEEVRNEGYVLGMQQGMQQGSAQTAAEVYERLRRANMPEAQARYMAYGTPMPEQQA